MLHILSTSAFLQIAQLVQEGAHLGFHRQRNFEILPGQLQQGQSPHWSLTLTPTKIPRKFQFYQQSRLQSGEERQFYQSKNETKGKATRF